jgi:hypothetical protein
LNILYLFLYTLIETPLVCKLCEVLYAQSPWLYVLGFFNVCCNVGRPSFIRP